MKTSIPKAAIELFTSVLIPEARILDAGCAAGRDSRILTDKGFVVTGIDLSKELLKIAKKENSDLDLIFGDLRKLPFKEEYFDGIFACGVLLELDKKDILKVLKEFQRVLKSGGIVFVRTKEGQGTRLIKKDSLAKVEREVTFLTVAELQNLFKKAGLAELKIFVDESHSRKGLMWINALYKKPLVAK
ncbi:MAG: class I SAM-dependent methyltransferase [bacterium]